MSADLSPFHHLIPGDRDPAPASLDDAHLLAALVTARTSLGRTHPNPAVGAVLVKDGAIVATGATEPAGQRHAEIVALETARVAGVDVRGGTLVVTLEPCVHHGRTPPCVDRVLKDGVARVVIGAVDPNPLVEGRGIAKLREAGVAVDVLGGAIADRCAALVRPFARAIVDKRAWILSKVAATLDGRVATPDGNGKVITGPEARRLVHALRDRCDAVLVGSGTVLADDPALTVRDVAGRDPVRVVVDSTLRTSPSARVYGARSIAVCATPPDERARAFEAAGVVVVRAAGADGRVDLAAMAAALAARGLTAVLAEPGPGLTTALWRSGAADEVWWLTAPFALGSSGRPALAELTPVPSPAGAPRLRVLARAAVGSDALAVFAP